MKKIEHQAPQAGEKWQIGTYTNLIYVGVGRDWYGEKYLIFNDEGDTFILKKDEFYSADLEKKCLNER